MTPRLRRLTPQRSRGFTLLEVMISVIFTGVLVLMIIGWVSTLMSTSANMLSGNTSASDLSYLSTTFGNDATSAVVCDPSGLGVPIYTLSSTEIGFYENDATTPGQIDLVLWNYAGGLVQRAVVTPSGGVACNFDASNPTWTTIASGVTSLQFIPWYQGSQAAMPPATGVYTCSSGYSLSGTNCVQTQTGTAIGQTTCTTYGGTFNTSTSNCTLSPTNSSTCSTDGGVFNSGTSTCTIVLTATIACAAENGSYNSSTTTCTLTLAATAPTSSGSCAGAAGGSTAPDNCIFDTIEMKVTEAGAAQGANQSISHSIDQSYSINLANSKLV